MFYLCDVKRKHMNINSYIQKNKNRILAMLAILSLFLYMIIEFIPQTVKENELSRKKYYESVNIRIDSVLIVRTNVTPKKIKLYDTKELFYAEYDTMTRLHYQFEVFVPNNCNTDLYVIKHPYKVGRILIIDTVHHNQLLFDINL